MSKICGILDFKGLNSSDGEEFYTGLKSLCSSNHDCISRWSGKNVGLFQIDHDRRRDGSDQEYPSPSGDHKLRIVADAALTNRTELLKEFGVLPFEGKHFSDGQLILKSYEKWGEGCPEHLSGDFAFAIWNDSKKELFCARDHFGASTLFYFKDAGQFIFGSQPKWILGFQKVEKRFNFDKLSTFLLREPHLLSVTQSWFRDIATFPAGTALTVDSNGIKTQKFWTPAIGKDLPYKSEDEIVERFRELLFEIIESRVPTDVPVASLLSGGLDSSSIVAVAAKVLEKQNREINVFAGIADGDRFEKVTDERYFIDQFKNFPNVKINYVTTRGKGPFSDLEEFFENYDTPVLTSRHYQYTEFSRRAFQSGSATLLDGCFGEMGATSHAWGGFAEMFANFKWLTLWRELRLRKALYDDSIRYNIRANTINPLIPDFLINLRHGRSQNEVEFNEFHPIQNNLAKCIMTKTDLAGCVRKRVSSNHRMNQVDDMGFIQKKMGENFPITYGKAPVELRYPFLEKRLIEFTSKVPVDLKLRNGYGRYLIRVALDGILPPEIQWRTSKSPFSPDYMHRYNSQIGEVREFLAGIGPNDPVREVLDIEKVVEWANLQIPDSERHTVRETIARDHLPAAVYLIHFLRTFSEFRI